MALGWPLAMQRVLTRTLPPGTGVDQWGQQTSPQSQAGESRRKWKQFMPSSGKLLGGVVNGSLWQKRGISGHGIEGDLGLSVMNKQDATR